MEQRRLAVNRSTHAVEDGSALPTTLAGPQLEERRVLVRVGCQVVQGSQPCMRSDVRLMDERYKCQTYDTTRNYKSPGVGVASTIVGNNS